MDPLEDWDSGAIPDTKGLSIESPEEGATIPGGANMEVVIKHDPPKGEYNYTDVIDLVLQRATAFEKDVVGDVALPGDKRFYPTEWEEVFKESYRWSDLTPVGNQSVRIWVPLGETTGGSSYTVAPSRAAIQESYPNMYRLRMIGIAIIGWSAGGTDPLYRTVEVGPAVPVQVERAAPTKPKVQRRRSVSPQPRLDQSDR
jgi:hypothetical protein